MAEVKAPSIKNDWAKDWSNNLTNLLTQSLQGDIESETSEAVSSGMEKGVKKGIKNIKKIEVNLDDILKIKYGEKNAIEKEIEEYTRQLNGKTSHTKIDIPVEFVALIDKKTTDLSSEISKGITDIEAKLRIGHKRDLSVRQDKIDKLIEKDPEEYVSTVEEAVTRFVKMAVGLQHANQLSELDKIDEHYIQKNMSSIYDLVILIGELSAYSKQFNEINVPKLRKDTFGQNDIFTKINDFMDILMSFPVGHPIRTKTQDAYNMGRSYGVYDIKDIMYGTDSTDVIQDRILKKTKSLFKVRKEIAKLEIDKVEQTLIDPKDLETLEKAEKGLNKLLTIYGQQKNEQEYAFEKEANRILDLLTAIDEERNEIQGGSYKEIPNTETEERTELLEKEAKQAKETEKAEESLGDTLLNLAEKSQKAHKKGNFVESQAFLNLEEGYITDIIEGTVNSFSEELSEGLREKAIEIGKKITTGMHTHSSDVATPSYDDFRIFASEFDEGITNQLILGFKEITKLDFSSFQDSFDIIDIGENMANILSNKLADYFNINNMEMALDNGRDIDKVIDKVISSINGPIEEIFQELEEKVPGTITQVKEFLSNSFKNKMSGMNFNEADFQSVTDEIQSDLYKELSKNVTKDGAISHIEIKENISAFRDTIFDSIADSVHKTIVGDEAKYGGKKVQDKIQLLQREALQEVLKGVEFETATLYQTQKFNLNKKRESSSQLNKFLAPTTATITTEMQEQVEQEEELNKWAGKTKEELKECLILEKKWLDECEEGTEAYNKRKANIEEINRLLSKQSEATEIQEGIHTASQAAIETAESLEKVEKSADKAGIAIKEALAYRGTNGEDAVTSNRQGFTFWSDSKEIAKLYGTEGPDKTLFSALLSMQNALEIDAKGAKWGHISYLGDGADEISRKMTILALTITRCREELEELTKADEKDKEAMERSVQVVQEYSAALKEFDALENSYDNPYGVHPTDWFAQYAKDKGYDGLYIKNVIDTPNAYTSKSNPSNVYVTFQREQLKNIKLLERANHVVLEEQQSTSQEIQENTQNIENQSEQIEQLEQQSQEATTHIAEGFIADREEVEKLSNALDELFKKMLSNGLENGVQFGKEGLVGYINGKFSDTIKSTDLYASLLDSIMSSITTSIHNHVSNGASYFSFDDLFPLVDSGFYENGLKSFGLLSDKIFQLVDFTGLDKEIANEIIKQYSKALQSVKNYGTDNNGTRFINLGENAQREMLQPVLSDVLNKMGYSNILQTFDASDTEGIATALIKIREESQNLVPPIQKIINLVKYGLEKDIDFEDSKIVKIINDFEQGTLDAISTFDIFTTYLTRGTGEKPFVIPFVDEEGVPIKEKMDFIKNYVKSLYDIPQVEAKKDTKIEVQKQINQAKEEISNWFKNNIKYVYDESTKEFNLEASGQEDIKNKISQIEKYIEKINELRSLLSNKDIYTNEEGIVDAKKHFLDVKQFDQLNSVLSQALDKLKEYKITEQNVSENTNQSAEANVKNLKKEQNQAEQTSDALKEVNKQRKQSTTTPTSPATSSASDITTITHSQSEKVTQEIPEEAGKYDLLAESIAKVVKKLETKNILLTEESTIVNSSVPKEIDKFEDLNQKINDIILTIASKIQMIRQERAEVEQAVDAELLALQKLVNQPDIDIKLNPDTKDLLNTLQQALNNSNIPINITPKGNIKWIENLTQFAATDWQSISTLSDSLKSIYDTLGSLNFPEQNFIHSINNILSKGKELEKLAEVIKEANVKVTKMVRTGQMPSADEVEEKPKRSLTDEDNKRIRNLQAQARRVMQHIGEDIPLEKFVEYQDKLKDIEREFNILSNEIVEKDKERLKKLSNNVHEQLERFLNETKIIYNGIYLNQKDLTTDKDFNYTERKGYYQQLAGKVHRNYDGSITLDQSLSTNYKALEQEIIKTDKALLILDRDIEKTQDIGADPTPLEDSKRIMGEYLQALEKEYKEYIKKIQYMPDKDQRSFFDVERKKAKALVENQIQQSRNNEEVKAQEKEINRIISERISVLNKLSSLEMASANTTGSDNLKIQEEERRRLLEISELEARNIALEQQRINLVNQLGHSTEKENDLLKAQANYTKTINDTTQQRKAITDEINRKKDADEATVSNNKAANLYKELLNDAKDYYDLITKQNSGKTLTNVERQRLTDLADKWQKATAAVDEYSMASNGSTASIRKYNEAKENFDNNNLNIANEQKRLEIIKDLTKYTNLLNGADEKWLGNFVQKIREAQAIIQGFNDNGFDYASANDIANLERLVKLKEEIESEKGLQSAKKAAKETLEKLRNKVTDFMENNSAMGKEFEKKFANIKMEIDNAESVKAVKDLTVEFLKLEDEVKAAGKTGKSFFKTIGEHLKSINAQFFAQYFSFQDMIRYGREFAQTVVEIDSALTELRKVSDSSTARLQESFQTSTNTAKELGSTITNVINQTADWARLGYDVDNAEKLARVTTLFQTVGDNMTTESASETLISTIKAYEIGVDEAERIVDQYNEIANNFAIDTAGLSEAITRSGAALHAASNEFSESLALIVAANDSLQDPSSVGQMLKTMSMRLRGASVADLEELGIDTEGMAKGTKSIVQQYKAMAGIDIMEGTNYKSTYQILDELHDKWADLSDAERAAITEATGGKRGGSVMSSLMTNWEDAEKVVKKAEESFGSAQKEQYNYSQSIQYSLDRLSASWQEFQADILSSSIVKNIVDLGNQIVNLLDTILKHPIMVGGLASVLIGGIAGNKFNFKELSSSLFNALSSVFNTSNIKNFTQGMFSGISEEIGVELKSAYETAFNFGNIGQGTQYIKQLHSLNDAQKKIAISSLKAKKNIDQFDRSIDTMAKGSKAVATALNAVKFTLVSMATMVVIDTIFKLINAHQELVNHLNSAADKFNEERNQIDDYKDSVKKLYKTINDNNASLDDQIEARKELYDIQHELMTKYGNEAADIDLVTTSIDKQNEALEKLIELKNSAQIFANWRSELEGTSEAIGQNIVEKWKNKIATTSTEVVNTLYYGVQLFDSLYKETFTSDTIQEIIDSPKLIRNDYEKMVDALKEFENYTTTFSVSENEGLNKVIEAYQNVTRIGNEFQITGDINEVSDTLLSIKTRLADYPGYTKNWYDELSGVLSTAEGIKKEFAESYDILISEEIQTNSIYKNYQNDLEKIYNEYLRAESSNDAFGTQTALENFSKLKEELEGNNDVPSYIRNYLLNPYTDAMDLVSERIRNTVDVINEKSIQAGETAKRLGVLVDDVVIAEDDALEAIINKLSVGDYSMVELLSFSDNDIKQLFEEFKSAYKTNMSMEELLEIIFDKSPEIASRIGKSSAEEFADSFAYFYKNTWDNPIFNEEELKNWFLDLDPLTQLETATWSDQEWEDFTNRYAEQAKRRGSLLQEDLNTLEDYNYGYQEQVDRFAEVKAEFFDLFNEEYDNELLPTVFGNIDLDNRQAIEWTDELLEENRLALQSLFEEAKIDWETFKEEWNGSISTVLGSVDTNSFGINIAYTPILQTADGPMLLDDKTIHNYIQSLLFKATDNDGEWTTEELLKLDAEGITKDGITIKNLIADIGDEAIATSLKMHFIGTDGAWNLARRAVENFKELFPETSKRLQQTGEDSDAFFNRINDKAKQSTIQVRALDAALENLDLEEFYQDSDISTTVKDYTTNIKPWIDSLGEAYKTLFYGDNGFDINVVDDALLESIRNDFAEIKKTFEDNGLDSEAFNSEALEKFLSVLSDGTTTAEQAQVAFNDYATSLFYSAEGLRNLNDSTANSIRQMLEKSGVTNYDEVVDFYLKLAEAEDIAIDKGIDLSNITKDEIDYLYESGQIAESTAQSFAMLALQKQLANNNNINTASDVAALYALAEQAGIDIVVLGKLKQVMDLFNQADAVEKYSTYEAEQLRMQAQALIQNALADVQTQVKVDLDFSVPKDATGAKDAAKETESEFEKALKNLQYLRDNDVITLKHYLDQEKKLIDDFYRAGKISAEDYFKYIHDWLREMQELYKSVISDVTSLLQKEIDKLEKERDKEIKELEKQRDIELDALDEQIKAQEEKIKLKQKEIDELQEANEERKRELDLQKALYELERARNQRTLLQYQEGADGKGQLVYRPDESAIREKSEEVEEQKYQKRISILEKELDLLNEQRDTLEEQRQAIEDHYQELIDKTNEYYDKAIEQIEEYMSRWEELAEIEERALMQSRLESLGLSIDDILALDEGAFESFKENYLGILADIYRENDSMTKALGENAGQISSYLEKMQPFFDGLEGIDLSTVTTAMQTVTSSLAPSLQTIADCMPNLTSGDLPNSLRETADALGDTEVNATGASGALETAGVKGTEAGANTQTNFEGANDEIKNTTKSLIEDSEESTSLNGGLDIVKEKSNTAIGSEEGVKGDFTKTGTAIGEATTGLNKFHDDLEDFTSKSYIFDIQIKTTGGLFPKLYGSGVGDFITSDDPFGKHLGGHYIAEFNGTVGNAFYNGYPGLQSSAPNALRSEFGQPELTVYPNGTYELTTTPTFADLPKDTVIFNEEQTKRILNNSKNSKFKGKSFANGSSPYLSLQDAMPDKAAMFAKFESNLQANLDKISNNIADMAVNVRDITTAVTNRTINNNGGNTIHMGNINVTCPGITETEVARNLGSAIRSELNGMVSGMAIRANQIAMRR